ncbi:MAG TPA: hypothetical protein VKY24_23975 [Reyranella sp.]|nr:hypothetical protein [Reyranella sp.]
MRKIDGESVTNASRPVRIKVTDRDVKRGVPKNPNACAIALACLRDIPGATAAKVHMSTCFVNIAKKGWQRWQVPEYATREIVAFDRGGKFVPCEVDLRPVPLIEKKQRRRSGSSSGGPRRPRRPRHVTLDVREDAMRNDPPTEE